MAYKLKVDNQYAVAADYCQCVLTFTFMTLHKLLLESMSECEPKNYAVKPVSIRSQDAYMCNIKK